MHHRPDGHLVDVGDLHRTREEQLRWRCHGGPPDDLVTLVGQDARRDPPAAKLPDVLAPGRADELSAGLRVEAMAEAPAH